MNNGEQTAPADKFGRKYHHEKQTHLFGTEPFVRSFRLPDRLCG